MVSFVDPRGVPSTPIDPYDLRLDTSTAPAIALLANGFPDSVRFLDAVGAELRLRLPEASVELFDKRDPTTVVPDDLGERIVERFDAVVAAYGH